MKKLFLIFISVSTLARALTVSADAVRLQLEGAALVADILILSQDAQSHSTLHAQSTSLAQVIKIHRMDPALSLPNQNGLIHIDSLGGEIAGRGMLYAGLPRPRTGMQYRAYLNPSSESHFSVTGFENGLVPLAATRSFSRNRTDGSNGSGNGAFLFWDASYFPIPYFISAPTFKNLPHMIPAIEESFKTWRAPDDVKLEFLTMGCSQNTHNENDGLNTILLLQDSWPFDPAAIAITRNFYISGDDAHAGLILDSDILLNGVNHQFTTTNETGKHDVQNIVTHEVGHFIGLGHETGTTDSDATMFAVASVNETKKRVLHSSDLLGLRSAYLGIGQKLQGTANRCTLPKDNLGCMAVQKRAFHLSGYSGAGIYLFLTLLLGRWFTRKSQSSD